MANIVLPVPATNIRREHWKKNGISSFATPSPGRSKSLEVHIIIKSCPPPSHVPLIHSLGLDLRRYSHLTTAILYRWLELLDSNPNKRRFQLWRISVQNYDVLRYTGKRVGDDPLPRDPAMSLEPGDYAAYYGMDLSLWLHTNEI